MELSVILLCSGCDTQLCQERAQESHCRRKEMLLRLFLLASDAPLSAALIPQLQVQSMQFPSKLTAPDQPGDRLTQSS